MVFISNGAVTKSPTYQHFTPASWNGWPQAGITQAMHWDSYSSMYRRQLWVSVLVNKIANASARLPLKVYERGQVGRPEVRDSAYAELLRNPNDDLDPYLFWLWTVSTLNVFGESFWLKVRDRGGRPVRLVPWHPTRMVDDTDDNGRRVWFLQRDEGRMPIQRRDFVHFRFYNPDSLIRGMSPMEPLRDTLENENGARAANSQLWKNGARPSFILRHPGKLGSTEAITRLRDQWNDIHGGVQNWSKTAVLEEGMEAQKLTFDAEELQYVESRKLNREEACAAYDVPPPVVHILDRATFSNITEQMRSMYRDTMAPKLKLLESTMETELRDGRMGRTGEPDFGPVVYAEFLMDEVLRGDFETRIAAMAQGIQTGQLMPSEARQLENRPFVDGSDQLFINAAVVPIDHADDVTPGASPNPSSDDVRSLMGRLSRQQTLAEVDPTALVAGMNGAAKTVLAELEAAQMADETVPQFRDRLRSMEVR